MNKQKTTYEFFHLNNVDAWKAWGFTLVELIVVITILAILWTIAFISLSWYSEQARDSTRISDLSSIKTGLELFQLDAGKYPLPTNWVNVTYSWTTVWNQWIFWDTVYVNLSKLDKIPVDPLTNSKYTYSVTLKRNEFELAWITETNELTSLNLLNNTYAWNVLATALVTWNYNWAMQKTLSWTNCYVLSLPTIIASDLNSSSDIQNIITNNRLVYNWFNNLPSSYNSSKFKIDWWFNFTPQQFVSYTDSTECSPLYDSVSSTARTTLITNLQKSYSWTIVETKWIIKQILSVDTRDTNAVTILWTTLINNNFWWKLEVKTPTTITDWVPSTSSQTIMIASNWTINLWWIPDNIKWVVLEWDVTWFKNSQTLWWWYGWVWVATYNGTIANPVSLTGSVVNNTNSTMTWTSGYTRIVLTQVNKSWSTFKNCSINKDLNLWFDWGYLAPSWWTAYNVAPLLSNYVFGTYWTVQSTSAYWTTPDNAAKNYWWAYSAVPWGTCQYGMIGNTWWMLRYTYTGEPGIYCPGPIYSTLCNAENNTARCPSSPPHETAWPLDNKYDLTFTGTWFTTTTWDSDRTVSWIFSTINWSGVSTIWKIDVINDWSWMYSNKSTSTCWGTQNWPLIKFGTYDRKEIIF